MRAAVSVATLLLFTWTADASTAGEKFPLGKPCMWMLHGTAYLIIRYILSDLGVLVVEKPGNCWIFYEQSRDAHAPCVSRWHVIRFGFLLVGKKERDFA